VVGGDDGEQLIGHQWLERESVVVTRDHCEVDRAHPQPAHQLVVVAVEHCHRERGMSPFEAGQQRGQDGERDAWHGAEADVATRQAIRLVALLADRLGLAEDRAGASKDALAQRRHDLLLHARVGR